MDTIEIAPASWRGSQRLHTQIQSAIAFVEVLLNFSTSLKTTFLNMSISASLCQNLILRRK